MDTILNPVIEGFWDSLMFGSPKELDEYISDIEADESLYPHRYDIYNASYMGLTPMEYVFDDASKQYVLKKVYND